jgi:hypothetical protein
MEKNGGGRPEKTGSAVRPVSAPTTRLSDLGISKTQSSRWQQLAAVPDARAARLWQDGPLRHTTDHRRLAWGGCSMPLFRVRSFAAGIWDQTEPREVEAVDSADAARKTCGARLIDRGTIGNLCAEVWPINQPSSKALYYRPSTGGASEPEPAA